MASAQGTSSRTKKSASTQDQQPRKAQSASSSPIPSVAKSSAKQRKEQDLSYLQRPTVPKPTSHPPQPPQNSNFDRPSTRAHGLEPRSDAAEQAPSSSGASSRTRKKKAETAPSPPSPTEESDQEIEESHAQGEDNTSVETIELGQSQGNTEEQAERNHPDEDVDTGDSPSTPPEPTAIPEVISISSTVSTASPAVLEESQNLQDERQSTPPPTTTTSDGDHSPPGPSTPVKVPAQIAIVHASPSKRVAFSPNKQESRLSTPGAAQTTALRGILKTPVRLPFQEEDTGAAAGSSGSDSANRRGVVDYPMDRESMQVEPFVLKAVESLGSDDLELRTKTYMDLQAQFRACNDSQHLEDVRGTIRSFTMYISRDLEPTNPPKLISAALKCAGYYLFNQNIVVLFTNREIESLLALILRLVKTTDDKATCNLAVWCLATARIPQRMVALSVPGMVNAFAENLDSRFKSLSITNESLLGLFSVFSQFPSEALPLAPSWLNPVIMKLVSNVPGIRSKALELITMVTPKLIEKEDARRAQVIQKFMRDHSTDFFTQLTQNFLENGDEVYALTVWGALVTLIGKPLQKSPGLNPMLKMVEKCFNTMSIKKNEIKMAAFQAWTRLIYNFAIGGHITSEKPLKLMLTPIKNGFIADRQKRVRLACANAWVSLVYALGPKLPEHAKQVLFEQLRHAISDSSEHIRELALRLLAALFSNSGGQELVEGRQNIVPGTITFTDLGLAEAAWVRSALLDEGLKCLHITLEKQSKLIEVDFKDWRVSALTGLPLLAQRCTKTWEAIVRAIRDINGQERELRATMEADLAIARLLLFIEKVSLYKPKDIMPTNWPGSAQRGRVALNQDMQSIEYIYRAEIVHYLYSSLIESFSAKTLASQRYRILDWVHAEIYAATHQGSEQVAPATGTQEQPSSQDQDLVLTPIESILKTWLVLGESVLKTAFETSFWQAVATLADMSKGSIHTFQGIYRAMHHMDDIKKRRQLRNTRPGGDTQSLPPLAFLEFQCKCWSIIGQRLGTTIHSTSELADMNKSQSQGYEDLFKLMTYPFTILHDPEVITLSPLAEDTERSQGSQETESNTERAQFMDKFKLICMPTWTDLLRVVYKVIQHKGNANAAMNTLAKSIRDYYHSQLPFIWIQSLSIACATVIVDTLVVAGPRATTHPLQRSSSGQVSYPTHRPDDFDQILALCVFLFSKAYTAIDAAQVACDGSQVPPIQESAFVLMEKIINKAPPLLAIEWLQQLQLPIVQWMDDSQGKIRDLPKANRRVYQARIEKLWSGILAKLQNSDPENNNGAGSGSAFGSVIAPRVPTIRSAANQAVLGEDAQGSRASSKSKSPYNSKALVLLGPLLFAGLNSLKKSIVNSTLEFWNKTFGLSTVDLEYPENLVSIFRQLKLVASISLPGWPYEDNSQTEVPQFASLSQDILSIPAELHARSGLSRLLKRKAEAAGQLQPRKERKRARNPTRQDASEFMTTTNDTGVVAGGSSHPVSTEDDDMSSTDSDSSEQSDSEPEASRKRARKEVEQTRTNDDVEVPVAADISLEEIGASTTPTTPTAPLTKEDRMVGIKVEPSDWTRQVGQATDGSILSPDEAGEDDERVANRHDQAMGSDAHAHTAQAFESSLDAPAPVAATTGSSSRMEENEALNVSLEMDVETEANTPPPSRSTDAHDLVSIPENGIEFVQMVQRLVDQRVAIGQLDMRQLFDLQNKLVTLNQTVCEAWGQLMKDHPRES